MEILVVLLPLALFLGGLFIAAFVWAVQKGQYDDLETPKLRMLLEDKVTQKIHPKKEGQ